VPSRIPAADLKSPRPETLWTSVVAVAVVIVILVIAGVSVASEKGAQLPRPRLTLLIEPAKLVVEAAEDVGFTFRLVNTGDVAITVCTWPGIALQSNYENPDGTVDRLEPKYPETAVLHRTDFRSLAPHEAIVGTASLHVVPTPVGYLRVQGKYRSGSDGARLRLNAWKGEVESRTIDIQVPNSVTE
jgi:hypothetical protein